MIRTATPRATIVALLSLLLIALQLQLQVHWLVHWSERLELADEQPVLVAQSDVECTSCALLAGSGSTVAAADRPQLATSHFSAVLPQTPAGRSATKPAYYSSRAPPLFLS